MSSNSIETKLKSASITYEKNKSLASFTTFKIGGPADFFVIAKKTEELIQAVRIAKQEKANVTVLGWGSNVLISDNGIRGIVIKNEAKGLEILGERKNTIRDQTEKKLNPKTVSSRLNQLELNKYYSFEDLNYDETGAAIIRVKIESGAGLPNTIMSLINSQITGLQWFGGIPGTIGGAVYNNIHGGSHFLSEYIESVEVFDPARLKKQMIQKEDCEFGYDFSRFHHSNEIILSAIFSLYKGDAVKAKATYIEWTRRKRIQPQRSAGSVWKNISEKERKRLGLESTGWGYIIDKILGLKGKRIGGAQISKNHAGFIENIGGAKSSDVLGLMNLIRKVAKEKIGIIPESEIFILGE